MSVNKDRLKEVIRLAYDNPEYRRDLLPAIKLGLREIENQSKKSSLSFNKALSKIARNNSDLRDALKKSEVEEDSLRKHIKEFGPYLAEQFAWAYSSRHFDGLEVDSMDGDNIVWIGEDLILEFYVSLNPTEIKVVYTVDGRKDSEESFRPNDSVDDILARTLRLAKAKLNQ